jgi:uncharacterized membrane protein YkvA (DUF1232 family)
MDDADGDPSLEQSAAGNLGRDLASGIRQLGKQFYWSLTRVAVRWQRWMRRLLPFFPILVIAALADRGLLQAWRSQGIRVLATYVPLMLYVYLRLLVTTKVRLMGKVALGAALAYALVRHDLITDRLPIAGYLDDAVIIVAATRLFLYTCPEPRVLVCGGCGQLAAAGGRPATDAALNAAHTRGVKDPSCRSSPAPAAPPPHRPADGPRCSED